MAHAHDDSHFWRLDASLLPGENPDLREELLDVFGNDWLNEPNIVLGKRPPVELLGTDEEFRVRLLLRSFKMAELS